MANHTIHQNGLLFKLKAIMQSILSLPRKLYDWTLKWATHPKGVRAYVFIAFIESIFFPIPVDPLLMALCISKYKKSLF